MCSEFICFLIQKNVKTDEKKIAITNFINTILGEKKKFTLFKVMYYYAQIYWFSYPNNEKKKKKQMQQKKRNKSRGCIFSSMYALDACFVLEWWTY